MIMKNRLKRIIITTGALLMFTVAPISQANPLGQYLNNMTTITAHAAELTQSARWVGEGNTWRVSDGAGGYLKNRWFQDDVTKDWYLLGADDGSVMFSGLVTDQSTGKSYLLNTNHDGTYGKMLAADGTYNINGKNVYLTFNQSHDGTFGAITSGLSEVRSTGIAEKQLPSIPSDNNTDGGSGQGQSVTPPSNEGNHGEKPVSQNSKLSSGSKVSIAPDHERTSGLK